MRRVVAGTVLLGACLGLAVSTASAHVPLRAVPHAEAPWPEALVPDPEPVAPLAPAAASFAAAPAPMAPVLDSRALALAALVLTALLLAGIPVLTRGMTARSVRGSLAVALVAVLCAIAFESAIHSVHHLSSEQEAARCSLASVSTNVSADVGPGPAVDVVLSAERSSVAVAEAVAPGRPPRRHEAGRAPPPSLPA